MSTITYNAVENQNTRLVFLIFAGLVLALLFTLLMGTPGPLALILGAQIVMLLLVIRRPVWIVAALLIGQLTASNYVFYVSGTQISGRFLWTILALVFLLYIRRQKSIVLGKEGRRVLIPAIILFVSGIISNMINTDLAYTMQYVRIVVTSLIILIILPAVIDDEKDVKLLALVSIIIVSISAVFALIQHYHLNIVPIAVTIYGNEVFNQTRAIGLNETPVDLSYTLPLIMLPIISFLFLKSTNQRMKILFIFLLIIMAAAQYFTYTRSGIYALGAGAITLVLFMKSRFKKEIFFAALIFIAAFVIYTDVKENRYSKGVENESSAAGRLVLWQAGSQIALSSPVFGIGGSAFKEVSEAYISSVNVNTDVVQAQQVLGIEQPHNDFLRIWVSYGTPALIAFIWLCVNIFRNFLDAYRKSSRKFIKALSLGCLAAFVTYTVSALAHNVIDVVCLIWVTGGLSIAMYKLSRVKSNNAVKASA
jgi:O-antigen ligase